MRTDIRVNIPGRPNPFLLAPGLRNKNGVWREFLRMLRAAIYGIAMESSINRLSARRASSLIAGLAPAQAYVTCAAAAAADTISLNGQALTAGQYRASGTVTFASVLDADTITVNGTIFTAKTAPTGNYQFARGVSDTADAAAFIAKVNAATTKSSDAVNGVGIFGKIEGSSAAAVATLYAIAEGTAGNAFTLASSNGGRLAVSAATLTLGAAAANNTFDVIGSNARTARSFCNNLSLSTTALLTDHFLASCRKATVTAASVAVGDTVKINETVLAAVKGDTDSGGARVLTNPPSNFSISTTDTNCASRLVNCINNHPSLMGDYFAVSSAGAVTVYERPPEATEPPKISTSNGTRLALTNTSNGAFADGADIFVQSVERGTSGNAKTIATSNGTRLAISGSQTRLTAGASTTFTL